MTFPYGEAVTVIHRDVSGRGDDGNDVIVEVSRVTVTVALGPGGSSEAVDNQEQVRDVLTAYGMPPDVAAFDRVLARGAEWEVDGNPQTFQSPFTGLRFGSVVQLVRVEG